MNDFEILSTLYNCCDPRTPASEDYYVDCSAVRGSKAVARNYQRALTLSKGFMLKLFSGHLGCGKSSELEHVAQVLRAPRPSMGNKRYYPVVLRTLEYLSQYDVAPVDILLAIVAELGDRFRTELGIELQDSLMTRRVQELQGILLRDVTPGDSVDLTIGGFKSSIKLLQRDADARGQVRQHLAPHAGTVLKEVNSVLQEARVKLTLRPVPEGDAPYTDLVLIIDDLEKIQRLAGAEEGEASQHRLFIERSEQFTGLGAHAIFTVPLTLARSEGPLLNATYGCELSVLPMIKVHRREPGVLYEAGRHAVTQILQRRLGAIPLDDAIRPDALDFLIQYTGGHLRNFLATVQQCAVEVAAPPVTKEAARRAIAEYVGVLNSSIRARWWPKLADLDRSSTQEVDNNDDDIREMLGQTIIMEYLNGEGETDGFSNVSPWYAVNPIVRELPQFKAAAAAAERPIP